MKDDVTLEKWWENLPVSSKMVVFGVMGILILIILGAGWYAFAGGLASLLGWRDSKKTTDAHQNRDETEAKEAQEKAAAQKNAQVLRRKAEEAKRLRDKARQNEDKEVDKKVWEGSEDKILEEYEQDLKEAEKERP